MRRWLACRWVRQSRIGSWWVNDSWPRKRKGLGSAGGRWPCRTCNWSAVERPHCYGPAESSSDWTDAVACSRPCLARSVRRFRRWPQHSNLVQPFDRVSNWVYWAMSKAGHLNQVCCLQNRRGQLVGKFILLRDADLKVHLGRIWSDSGDGIGFLSLAS